MLKAGHGRPHIFRTIFGTEQAAESVAYGASHVGSQAMLGGPLRPCSRRASVPFATLEQPYCVQKSNRVKRLDHRMRIERGELPSEWRAFPVKSLPVRTAKYEVELREASLQLEQSSRR